MLPVVHDAPAWSVAVLWSFVSSAAVVPVPSLSGQNAPDSVGLGVTPLPLYAPIFGADVEETGLPK